METEEKVAGREVDEVYSVDSKGFVNIFYLFITLLMKKSCINIEYLHFIISYIGKH